MSAAVVYYPVHKIFAHFRFTHALESPVRLNVCAKMIEFAKSVIIYSDSFNFHLTIAFFSLWVARTIDRFQIRSCRQIRTAPRFSFQNRFILVGRYQLLRILIPRFWLSLDYLLRETRCSALPTYVTSTFLLSIHSYTSVITTVRLQVHRFGLLTSGQMGCSGMRVKLGLENHIYSTHQSKVSLRLVDQLWATLIH